MSDYEERTSIQADAEAVFRFLSSIDAIPGYLPWIRSIRSEEDDHVFAVAEQGGRRHELSGYFRVSEELRRIDWGSDGTPEYRGWLEVRGAGDKRAELTVHLSMEGARDEGFQRQLQSTLDAIREAIERRGAGDVIGQQRRVA